jgi:hypothetical protein
MDLSTSFDDVWVEELQTRVVLPEGAHTITPTVRVRIVRACVCVCVCSRLKTSHTRS